jgi:murein DD-endopeptidase MepM/ murein hydrolase activator NlpD
MHTGIDINATVGTELQAAEGGRIVRMSNGPVGGNRLDIGLPDGATIIYVHIDSVSEGLSVGDEVAEGTVVGEAGVTGNAANLIDAPDQQHLHLAVKDRSGNLIDPEAWLNEPDEEADVE